MRLRSLVAPSALALLLGSCGGTDSPTLPPAPVATSITLSASNLTFASLGQTQQLTAAVLDQRAQPMPALGVSWASSSPAVATVSSSGLVTSFANGTTTITATSGAAAASASVTVQQAAASLVVVPSAVTLVSIGATQQLTATVKDQGGTVMPGAAVTWASSNPSVAVASSAGLVTAVARGTATITAASGGATGSATVEVTLPPVATVTVSPLTASIPVGGTRQLTATMKDAAGNSLVGRAVTWSSSSATAASVSATGLVTGVAAGMAVITATSEGQPGNAVITVTDAKGLGPEQFVRILPGIFQMGSTTGDMDERPVHTVIVTRSFYLQKTEVTQGQWTAVMGTNPSYFKDCGDDCPVEMVSWNDAQDFITRLNQANPGMNYRLPTEAEWEYAARANTTTDYGGNGVLSDMGWYWNNSAVNGAHQTHAVAKKLPNAWGLYDMHGNVSEWVQDWSGSYPSGTVNDPTGPASGTFRVLRGGSWSHLADVARSANRSGDFPSSRYFANGFRLARTP